MDGFTATRLIRAAELETGRARTPIVALSADVLTHQVAAYEEAGMDGHLAKPIEVGRLFETIQATWRDRADSAGRASHGASAATG
jgi:CheY-like chemotaxis protein